MQQAPETEPKYRARKGSGISDHYLIGRANRPQHKGLSGPMRRGVEPRDLAEDDGLEHPVLTRRFKP